MRRLFGSFKTMFWNILTQLSFQIDMSTVVVNTWWWMWLSLWLYVFVCAGAVGGLDLASANPWCFPDVKEVAAVSVHPLSRTARGQLLRPCTRNNICKHQPRHVPTNRGILIAAASSQNEVFDSMSFFRGFFVHYTLQTHTDTWINVSFFFLYCIKKKEKSTKLCRKLTIENGRKTVNTHCMWWHQPSLKEGGECWNRKWTLTWKPGSEMISSYMEELLKNKQTNKKR